jgi:hypothetical protein
VTDHAITMLTPQLGVRAACEAVAPPAKRQARGAQRRHIRLRPDVAVRTRTGLVDHCEDVGDKLAVGDVEADTTAGESAHRPDRAGGRRAAKAKVSVVLRQPLRSLVVRRRTRCWDDVPLLSGSALGP